MLTVAYCRVSTEEQAAEGFSIAGQADKLRVYAELHDLGEVTVIADPGVSGRNLERPGLQKLLRMVDEGHVANVLTCRLDRLSRNLGDLIMLADRFGQAGVALHSFTEKIDLSSATGRMFYNILGSFAQFYREQLAENVRMGMQQAVPAGQVDQPSEDRLRPRRRRARPQRNGARRTAHLHLALPRPEPRHHRRRHRCEVLDGADHPRLSHLPRQGPDERRVVPRAPRHDHRPEQFAAAHRGRIKGRARGQDLLSGKVRCGLCKRLMSLDQNGEGRMLYRCQHRGQGCAQPRRTNHGLIRAAVLGLRLISDARRSRHVVDLLEGERRKLLRLYYDDRIGPDLFAEEEARLSVAIREAKRETEAA